MKRVQAPVTKKKQADSCKHAFLTCHPPRPVTPLAMSPREGCVPVKVVDFGHRDGRPAGRAKGTNLALRPNDVDQIERLRLEARILEGTVRVGTVRFGDDADPSFVGIALPLSQIVGT
jgi:hypothetical protein